MNEIFVPSYHSNFLFRKVFKCLQNKENRRDFEEWYLKKYGKPYEWRKHNESIQDNDSMAESQKSNQTQFA